MAGDVLWQVTFCGVTFGGVTFCGVTFCRGDVLCRVTFCGVTFCRGTPGPGQCADVVARKDLTFVIFCFS